LVQKICTFNVDEIDGRSFGLLKNKNTVSVALLSLLIIFMLSMAISHLSVIVFIMLFLKFVHLNENFFIESNQLFFDLLFRIRSEEETGYF